MLTYMFTLSHFITSLLSQLSNSDVNSLLLLYIKLFIIIQVCINCTKLMGILMFTFN